MEHGCTLCSILLIGEVDASNNVSLTWNEYIGWSGGVADYTVEKIFPNNDVVAQNITGNTFDEQETSNQFQTVMYRIIANPNDPGIPPAISNIFTIIKPTNLYAPTAFTPDGDRLNDDFMLGGNFIVSFELKIFTRWGELIFSSDNLDTGWNGQLNGRDLPEGTYTYRAKVTDTAGREQDKFGTVLLIRN
ncbi:MAG: gliding motility-associated C-terminal domain-containing protein, partial [Bacteroidota bacterium]